MTIAQPAAAPQEQVPPAVPMPPPAAPSDADGVIAGTRARIDALDEQLIGLIRQRMAASADVQRARMGAGGPRLSLARENEILTRYRSALGRPGTDLAMLLLELCRGRA